MDMRRTVRQGLLGLLGVAMLGIATVAPAAAADPKVTQVINGGGAFSASIGDASLTSVTYSNSAQSGTGTLSLSVSDPRGTSAGWNVTIKSTDFQYTGGGSQNPSPIPATGFSITSLGAPVQTAGQAVDATGGPYLSGSAPETLDQTRKVVAADIGFGSGNYTQSLGVSLAIPAMSQTGTYQATLTVLITSGP